MPVESETLSILYVGADSDSTPRTAEILEQSDEAFTVSAVIGSQAALDRLADGDVDCLISAHDLPEIDGIQLLQVVRTVYPTLPFILSPTAGSEQLASAALAAGATDYMPRRDSSNHPEQLVARIRAAIDRSRMTEDCADENRLAESVLDGAPDAVLFSVDNELVYANRVAVELFGTTSREQLLGRRVGSLADWDPELWLADSDREKLTRHRESIPFTGDDPNSSRNHGKPPVVERAGRRGPGLA